jgi:choline dehydrogenase-like flavoprotein
MKGPAPIATHYDAVIVGARVAGASTPCSWRRAGCRFLAVDRADARQRHDIHPRPDAAGMMAASTVGACSRASSPRTRRHPADHVPLRPEAVEVAIKRGMGGRSTRRAAPSSDRLLADAAAEAGRAQVLHDVVAGRDALELGTRGSGARLTDAAGERGASKRAS